MKIEEMSIKEFADLAKTKDDVILIMLNNGKMIHSMAKKENIKDTSEFLCSYMLNTLENLKEK